MTSLIHKAYRQNFSLSWQNRRITLRASTPLSQTKHKTTLRLRDFARLKNFVPSWQNSRITVWGFDSAQPDKTKKTLRLCAFARLRKLRALASSWQKNTTKIEPV